MTIRTGHRNYRYLPKSQGTGLDIISTDRARNTDAAISSRALLKALLTYGIRNGRGLPNMTPDMCRAGLMEMEMET